ncbi:MAG: PAS domain S-box protein [Haloarculaceae archaeon]
MVDGDAARSLLDHATDKIAVIGSDGRFQYVNDAAERILGYDPDTLVGEDAFALVHPDDRERVRRSFERVIGADEEADLVVTYRYRATDDSWVWLESRMSNHVLEGGEGYVVSSRDITDRVRAEERREEARQRREEIAAAARDVLWMFDAAWEETLFLNAAFEDVYGRPREEVLEDPVAFLECVHPADVPRVEAVMERLSAGDPIDIEYRVDPGSNFERWVWVQGEPIREDGEVVRVAGFSRDVTDKRRQRRQLAVLDTLLRHNLRNDLQTILGQVELLADGDEDVETRAETIQRVGESLLEKAEKERQTIDLLTGPRQLRTIDVAEVARRVAADVRGRYPDATVETAVPPSMQVRTLPEIEAALTELVENAIEHHEGGTPTVTLRIEREADSASVVVEDDCPPIPESEYRVLTEAREISELYHSSGIGLWLVYWVIDLSGGDVAFGTRESGGNRITVSLPVPEE